VLYHDLWNTWVRFDGDKPISMNLNSFSKGAPLAISFMPNTKKLSCYIDGEKQSTYDMAIEGPMERFFFVSKDFASKEMEAFLVDTDLIAFSVQNKRYQASMHERVYLADGHALVIDRIEHDSVHFTLFDQLEIFKQTVILPLQKDALPSTLPLSYKGFRSSKLGAFELQGKRIRLKVGQVIFFDDERWQVGPHTNKAHFILQRCSNKEACGELVSAHRSKRKKVVLRKL